MILLVTAALAFDVVVNVRHPGRLLAAGAAARVGAGPLVPLRDDGAHPDPYANDGRGSATRAVPSGGATVTVLDAAGVPLGDFVVDGQARNAAWVLARPGVLRVDDGAPAPRTAWGSARIDLDRPPGGVARWLAATAGLLLVAATVWALPNPFIRGRAGRMRR